MSHEDGGAWHAISAREMYRRVYRVAQQLRAWGVRKGDRVALIAENRFEWAITDWACLLIGAVDVPIYPTLTAEQSLFILQNSGARVAVVSTAKQLQKILSVKSGTALEHVVVMDDAGSTDAVWAGRIMQGHESVTRDAAFEEVGRAIRPDDLATIIYTSGTTGVPKGVMLTHGNLASNLAETSRSLDWRPGLVFLSFLPLSHVTARHVDYLCFLRGVTVAYCPSFDELPAKLKQVRPHLFVAVPRVYEKVRQEVERRATSGVKQKILSWAQGVGARCREQVLRGEAPSNLQWKLANRLVYRPIKLGFGGRVEMFLSGGAPLGIDLARWYADMGIRIFEGYGLTETSPVIAVNDPHANKIGTVGKPLSNVECRIAADGELLVRGPSVFKGYWNNPAETAAAFEGDWFKTGDIAELDADGFLRITDRKKDLIKTSGGKFVAPQPIENKLKMSPLIGHVALVGNTRKFVSAVICPNFPALERWAGEHEIPFSSRAELVGRPEALAEYQKILEDVNSGLAQFETIKKFVLTPEDFSIEAGEITATLKLRRRVIEAKYKKEIDALYEPSSPIAEHA